jgi:DNA-binding HxlR family transcriptional regulator
MDSVVDPCSGECPSRALLDLVGDRWSLLVMLVVGRVSDAMAS